MSKLSSIGFDAARMTLGKNLAAKGLLSEELSDKILLPVKANSNTFHIAAKTEHESLYALCGSKDYTMSKDYFYGSVLELPDVYYCKACLNAILQKYSAEVSIPVDLAVTLEGCLLEIRQYIDLSKKNSKAKITYNSIKNYIRDVRQALVDLIDYSPEHFSKLNNYYLKQAEELIQVIKNNLDAEDLLTELRIDIQETTILKLDVFTELSLSLKANLTSNIADWKANTLAAKNPDEKREANALLLENILTDNNDFFHSSAFYPEKAAFDQKDYISFKEYLKAELEASSLKAAEDFIAKLEKTLEEETKNLASPEKFYYTFFGLTDFADLIAGDSSCYALSRLTLLLVSEKTTSSMIYCGPKLVTYLTADKDLKIDALLEDIHVLGPVEETDTPEMLEIAASLLSEDNVKNILSMARKILN